MSLSPPKHKSSHHHHHHHHHHHRHSSPSVSHEKSSWTKLSLNLPSYIKIQDNSKLLPHYSVALSKPHDEFMPMDELDAIQLELETLLSSVALRYRSLKTEYDYLEDRKHQKKNRDLEKASSPSTSSKRKRDEKKSDKKDSSRYSSHTKHARIKSSSSHSPAHSQNTDHSGSVDTVSYPSPSAGRLTNPKLTLPKNDVPNKFWLSVEPYCMPITHEDIKLIDNLIEEYSEPLVPSIPDLGAHYTFRWTSDDLRTDHDGAINNSKSNKRNSFSSIPTDVKESTSKCSEKVMGQGVCGPLTQRLVSALFEDKSDMHSDIDRNIDEKTVEGNDAQNNPSTASRGQNNAITSLLKSGIDVEKRLKKELFDLGILDATDFEKEKDDEVLNEIKRVRTELQAIAEYNRDELKLLKTAAKEEMKRLEVKRRIDRIDQEIIEAYKRVFAAKQKRRPLSKHERTDIFRLVEEQKRLSDQLETMPIPGFNFAVGSKTKPTATKTEPSTNASNI